MTPIGSLLRLPLKLVPRLVPMRILSGPLAGKRWLSTSATHGCWLGTYESDLQRELARVLRNDDVFYDVGANVGFFSLLAAQSARQVVAFEPLPRNVQLLRRNLSLNNAGNVTVIEAAVGDKPADALFDTGPSTSQGRIAQAGIPVKVITLDARGPGVSTPTVIKMDIEGGESRALAGALNLLQEHRPRIYLSTHGYREHEACCEFLRQIGYRITVRRDGTRDGQYELVAS